jgi:hypothetical protein
VPSIIAATLLEKAQMIEERRRKSITSRFIRLGDPLPEDDYWDEFTTEDRMNALWEL